MSRIGRKPIPLPKGVEVKVNQSIVNVKGPKGTLSETIDSEMKVEVVDNEVIVTRPNDVKKYKALHGLTRALVNNMVVGVTEGFTKTLEINGVGYRAQKQGKKVVLTLGYSHPVEYDERDGVTIDVQGNKLIVSGIDKQKVGQVSAELRDKRRPDVYKGKGIKYDYEIIRRKEGKTGKK
jgi:large subunit ribosomal protein L6